VKECRSARVSCSSSKIFSRPSRRRRSRAGTGTVDYLLSIYREYCAYEHKVTPPPRPHPPTTPPQPARSAATHLHWHGDTRRYHTTLTNPKLIGPLDGPPEPTDFDNLGLTSSAVRIPLICDTESVAARASHVRARISSRRSQGRSPETQKQRPNIVAHAQTQYTTHVTRLLPHRGAC